MSSSSEARTRGKGSPRVAPFERSFEHLQAEVAWLDTSLLALVRASRGPNPQTAGHGWFVSADEAESFLTLPPAAVADTHALRTLRETRKTVDARRSASIQSGIRLSLPALVKTFGLSAIEELLLVACLAAHRDDRYGQVYGYLHDDLTRRQPSLQLVARLARLGHSPSSDSAFDSILVDDLPVFRWELVSTDTASLLPRVARGWWIDPQIAEFMLDHDWSESLFRTAADHDLPVGDPDVEPQILNVIRHGGGAAVLFHGPGVAEAESIAHRVCRKFGTRLIHADLALLLEAAQASSTSFASLLRRVYREALLRGGSVYLSGMDSVRADARRRTHLTVLEELIDESGCVTFLASEPLWLPRGSGRGRILPLYLPGASYEARRKAWGRALGAQLDSAVLDSMAARYAMSTRDIGRAVDLAGTRAIARESFTPDETDVTWACRLQSATALDGLARRVRCRAGWQELILPEDVFLQLREVCAHVRHRAGVLHRWGFDRLLSGGKGVYALFVGPGGTGKTLAAEVLASTLDLDLVKVDLSSVVNKYIGETEKNLERIFDATERSDAMLFFDEADALFGKRSEIKDAHDRYANIEVGFLLQRLEAYEGFVVLASNLASNIDNAFARRMQFLVEFPFPDEAARLAIWKRHLPAEAPIDDDLNLPWLARELNIAGGNIRNVVFNAAFMAADEGARLGMRHLMRAAQREYGRLGKVYRFDGPRVPQEVPA